MIGPLDLSLSTSVLWALAAAVCFPFLLAGVARAPRLTRRNALQFLVTSVATTVGWAALSYATTADGPSAWDLAVGAMLLMDTLIVYLEVWALLSRGYTLGMLLTLYRASAPLDEFSLAKSYRTGEGLGWIMKHRLQGLERTGLVTTDHGRVRLTPVLGVPAAGLYLMTRHILGLRQSG